MVFINVGQTGCADGLTVGGQEHVDVAIAIYMEAWMRSRVWMRCSKNTMGKLNMCR